MTEPVWDKFLTDRDKAVFAAVGFGATADPGKRPALLVIEEEAIGVFRHRSGVVPDAAWVR